MSGRWATAPAARISPTFGFDDFRVVRDNLAGGHRVTTGRQVPSCRFTDPELARVGLSESEARAQGGALPAGETPHGGRAPHPDALRAARLHEGTDRGGRRPHPRLHRIRR